MLRLSPRGEIAIPIAFTLKNSANSVKLGRLPRPRPDVSFPAGIGIGSAVIDRGFHGLGSSTSSGNGRRGHGRGVQPRLAGGGAIDGADQARLLGPATGGTRRRRDQHGHLSRGLSLRRVRQWPRLQRQSRGPGQEAHRDLDLPAAELRAGRGRAADLQGPHGLRRASAIVPRRIDILEASWGGPSASIDVTQQVRDICGDGSTRCQVPAMAYIFGMPDRLTKTLRIRYTCNGQTTPGRQATENSVADLRCEQPADLGY